MVTRCWKPVRNGITGYRLCCWFCQCHVIFSHIRKSNKTSVWSHELFQPEFIHLFIQLSEALWLTAADKTYICSSVFLVFSCRGIVGLLLRPVCLHLPLSLSKNSLLKKNKKKTADFKFKVKKVIPGFTRFGSTRPMLRRLALRHVTQRESTIRMR